MLIKLLLGVFLFLTGCQTASVPESTPIIVPIDAIIEYNDFGTTATDINKIVFDLAYATYYTDGEIYFYLRDYTYAPADECRPFSRYVDYLPSQKNGILLIYTIRNRSMVEDNFAGFAATETGVAFFNGRPITYHITAHEIFHLLTLEHTFDPKENIPDTISLNEWFLYDDGMPYSWYPNVMNYIDYSISEDCLGLTRGQIDQMKDYLNEDGKILKDSVFYVD